jgi:hypothetical protein
MIEGYLEALTPAGVFVGWLRDAAGDTPAVVQVRHEGQVVAEAAARSFRADLLAAGHGHGHYGFAARLRVALAPGPAGFELYVPRRDQGMRLRLIVPAMPPAPTAHVGDLVQGEVGWRGGDLAAKPGCVDMAGQCRAMGTGRFVDATFQFVLQRWPTKAEAQVYRLALDEERLAPEGFLIELLAGRERADLGDSLASPWDPAFPFLQAERAEVPAAASRRKRGAA